MNEENPKKDKRIVVAAYLELLEYSQLPGLTEGIAANNENSLDQMLGTMDCNEDIFITFKKGPNNCLWRLAGTNIQIFIDQLTNVIAAAYVKYSSRSMGRKRPNTILVRGGISDKICNDFSELRLDEKHLYNDLGKVCLYSEKLRNKIKIKGPRLFFNKSTETNLENTDMLREVDTDAGIYEIVWTVKGCESCQSCESYKKQNIDESIHCKMLPAAINLVKFNSDDLKFSADLKDLLKLVCQGIVRYAEINEGKSGAQEALQSINKELSKNGLDNYGMEELLEGFV